MAEDLAAFGLDDQVPRFKAKSFGIYPENLTTVQAFLVLEEFWIEGKTADGSVRMVMDHGQIKNTLELMGVKRRAWPDVFDGLKAMETEAIAVLFGVSDE